MTFGDNLKHWRGERRMSQLDLGLSANVSARHISFLETGRAAPSRAMVMQLCEELAVPHANRNQMLVAAGLAPAYTERGLSEEEMTPVREAIDWLLKKHDPYPAMALDRHWTVVQLNRSAGLLLAGLGLGPGDSLLESFTKNEAVRSSIENLDEVLSHICARIRTEIAHFGGDDVLEDGLATLSALLPGTHSLPEGLRPAFIPTRYRMGGMSFAFFSTFSQFGGVEDIALSELKIEMMFPADEATKTALNAIGE
ncbi:MAG: helix-turn-helix domain-containing protein [Pseudomonadota bacterium]